MTKIDKFIQIKTNDLKPRRGRVLLSEPLMGDYYFGRSVVLLAEHDTEGSLGIIVNKIINTNINNMVPDFPQYDAPLYLGGPVERDKLIVLHTLGDKIPNSKEIIKGLYLGGDIDDIKEMIELKLVDDSNVRFFAGYSGWTAGQLENELKRNSWVITNASSDKIFSKNPENLWDDLIKKLGDNYRYWEKFPKNPSYN